MQGRAGSRSRVVFCRSDGNDLCLRARRSAFRPRSAATAWPLPLLALLRVQDEIVTCAMATGDAFDRATYDRLRSEWYALQEEMTP